MQSLVQQWPKKAAEVKASTHRLCQVFGISRSWLHERSKRIETPPACPLREAVQTVFNRSGKTYGSRRIHAELRAQGLSVGRYKIRQLMRTLALTARWRRPFIHTTDSQHGLPLADNLLDRRFQWTAPNQAWVSDITYVRTECGWLYLAAVMDLHSRKIIGWATSDSMPASLVCEALQMAIDLRKPNKGLIVHSDRGSQYASHLHRDLLKKHGFIQSMSRKGNCWDNAVMERFFSISSKNVSGTDATPTTWRR